jgi:hypothetical protein
METNTNAELCDMVDQACAHISNKKYPGIIVEQRKSEKPNFIINFCACLEKNHHDRMCQNVVFFTVKAHCDIISISLPQYLGFKIVDKHGCSVLNDTNIGVNSRFRLENVELLDQCIYNASVLFHKISSTTHELISEENEIKEKLLAQRDLLSKEVELAQKEVALAQKKLALAQKEVALAQKEVALAQKKVEILAQTNLSVKV